MQFGISIVGDITTDSTTGKVPSEHQCIKSTVEMVVLAEQAGLNFFVTGEYHNPPFTPSSPTVLLANIAARTDKPPLSIATTLIATNNPVYLAEEYAYLRRPSDGRVDLMMGRGNTGSVYLWFGEDIRKGILLAVENYDLLCRLQRETNVNWGGEFHTVLQDFTSMPRPLDGVSPFVWHVSVRPPQVAGQVVCCGDGYLRNNIFWLIDHVEKVVDLYRERFAFYGHGRPEQTIVGLGGQIFAAKSETEIIERYTPYFRSTCVYRGTSLEETTQYTPLAVGTPEWIVEKYLTYRDTVDDYQCQAFNLDLDDIPYKEVMKQTERLGSEIVPALRVELEPTRPEGVPDALLHPRHRVLLEGTEPLAEEPFFLSNGFDPSTGWRVGV